MSLVSDNSIKYARSFLKLIVFDPKCQDEFNSIVQDKGPRSIKGLYQRLKLVDKYIYASLIGVAGLPLGLFWILAIILRGFKENFKQKRVSVVYYGTYLIYLPAVVFVVYFLTHLVRMKGLLKSPDENLCSSSQITKYFTSTSSRNNSALWWHILLLVKLVVISASDYLYFRRFRERLGTVETPSQREEKILAQYEGFNLSDGLT